MQICFRGSFFFTNKFLDTPKDYHDQYIQLLFFFAIKGDSLPFYTSDASHFRSFIVSTIRILR